MSEHSNGFVDRVKRIAAPCMLGAFVIGFTAGYYSTNRTEQTNLCAEDNPSFEGFNPENDLLANARNVLAVPEYPEEVSEMEGDFIQTALNAEYGVTLTFPEQTQEDAVFTYGTINADPVRKQKAVTASLRGITTAFSMFSPEVVKGLELSEISFVKGIVKKPNYKDDHQILDAAGGLYNGDENRIYIDVDQLGDGLGTQISGLIVHEISHAIDARLLCSNNDVNIDTALTSFNTQKYRGYNSEGHKVDAKYIKPAPTREFVDNYGITSPAEDRATILEWTFTQRGLILEGDRDWNSPLQHKQEEIVRRMDSMTPGVRKFLEEQTVMLRARPFNNELDKSIESPLVPGEIMSAADIVKTAASMQGELEIFEGGILQIDDPSAKLAVTIENPIIIRDPAGKLAAVAWGTDNPYDISAKFFDQHRMKLYTADKEPKLSKGVPVITVVEQNLRINSIDSHRRSITKVDQEALLAKTPNLVNPNTL